jgi:nucleotide-binding universal stress UspA family protein
VRHPPVSSEPLIEARLGSIFHPSDFSRASEIAFEHALRIALVTRSRLNVLHVAEESDYAAASSAVRNTLCRWGLLSPDSSDERLAQLGIEVNKIVTSGVDPVTRCVDFLEQHPAELIVLAVHQHEGRVLWMRDRISEPISSQASEMTLFIPHGVAGFVSHADGSVALQNILVPVATTPRAEPALEAAGLMVGSMGLPGGTFHLLHAGRAEEAPQLRDFRAPEGWEIERIVVEGEPVETILGTARAVSADMIAMTTDGPNGFLDALRGSTSSRVLRRTRCPVMSLPAGHWPSRVRRFWNG